MYCSDSKFVSRIGVINTRGWLLTLAGDVAKKEVTDTDYYGDEDDKESAKYDELSEDRLYQSLEYTKEDLYDEDQEVNVEDLKQVLESRLHQDRVYAECKCPVPGPQYSSSLTNHPIHSITNSDIEKAVVGKRRKWRVDFSTVACLIVAILIAIASVLSITFMIINILSNMDINY